MVKRALIFFISVFIMAACTPHEQGIINNPKILEELEAVGVLSLMDGNNRVLLARIDLNALNESVSKDLLASHYMEELYWMVNHNESEHLGHTLDFLGTYLETGQKSHCTPHEVWHATIYARHRDWERVEHATEDAVESFPFWVEESKRKREKFPQFYLRLDKQREEVKYAINQLQKKNYSDGLMQRIDTLSETAVC